MYASTSASLSSMNAPSLGHFVRSWSATWRRVWLALGRSGWMKAWRSGGDHGVLAFWHVRQGVAHPVHDPNAIDALRFSMSLPFVWPAIARPRQRRLSAP